MLCADLDVCGGGGWRPGAGKESCVPVADEVQSRWLYPAGNPTNRQPANDYDLECKREGEGLRSAKETSTLDDDGSSKTPANALKRAKGEVVPTIRATRRLQLLRTRCW